MDAIVRRMTVPLQGHPSKHPHGTRILMHTRCELFAERSVKSGSCGPVIGQEPHRTVHIYASAWYVRVWNYTRTSASQRFVQRLCPDCRSTRLDKQPLTFSQINGTTVIWTLAIHYDIVHS